MPRREFPLGVVNNPLNVSLYNDDYQEGVISPGNGQFIVTESFIKITTESGRPLVTES